MLASKLRKPLTSAITLRGNGLERPADADTIEITSRSLQDDRLLPLPSDDGAFLAISNGFVGPNCILAGACARGGYRQAAHRLLETGHERGSIGAPSDFGAGV